MKIPKKLKTGGHEVKIAYPYHFKERTDICGQYDWPVNEIKITDVDPAGNKMAESNIIVSLIHEVLHAVDITSGHGVFTEKENAIEGISQGIFQVLADNGFLKIE